jgi:hypothetical protein
MVILADYQATAKDEPKVSTGTTQILKRLTTVSKAEN